MIDTNRLWLCLLILTVIGLIIALPRLRSSSRRLTDEMRRELEMFSYGSAYDAMVDEEPTQPLPAQEAPVRPKWEQQFDEIMQIGWEVLHKKGA